MRERIEFVSTRGRIRQINSTGQCELDQSSICSRLRPLVFEKSRLPMRIPQLKCRGINMLGFSPVEPLLDLGKRFPDAVARPFEQLKCVASARLLAAGYLAGA